MSPQLSSPAPGVSLPFLEEALVCPPPGEVQGPPTQVLSPACQPLAAVHLVPGAEELPLPPPSEGTGLGSLTACCRGEEEGQASLRGATTGSGRAQILANAAAQ